MTNTINTTKTTKTTKTTAKVEVFKPAHSKGATVVSQAVAPVDAVTVKQTILGKGAPEIVATHPMPVIKADTVAPKTEPVKPEVDPEMLGAEEVVILGGEAQKASQSFEPTKALATFSDLANLAKSAVGAKAGVNGILTRAVRCAIQHSEGKAFNLINELVKSFRSTKKGLPVEGQSAFSREITAYCRDYLGMPYDKKLRCFANIEKGEARNYVWLTSPKNPDAKKVGQIKAAKSYSTPLAMLERIERSAEANFEELVNKINKTLLKQIDDERECAAPNEEAIKANTELLSYIGLVMANLAKAK